ncbi:MAG: hypothetical protein PHO08_00420 [Methylococcales bacterium]|nr:hypothetical protein [Methylococcales bacterium]MDD5631108.1 hypothetical protein [Methylococcales bacterium]
MNDFHFKPRQEAYPMKWGELLSPVRRAVADLLIHIYGAELENEARSKDKKDKREVANCFLVYGIRGTGKTTVLHSAKEAISSQEDFFTPLKTKEERQDNELNEYTFTKKSVEYLKNHIVWLPILNLEPLTANTNLLTTVLTRVRDALDKKNDGDKKSPALTSIYEEDSDSPRQQLNKLIHDATLIWEDILEVDTRGKASRQAVAADIYASFSESFKKAMDALSKQLSREHGTNSNGCSIVLPIDNIDRSADHLRAIVKLAQLLTHTHLWLVLAGDRADVETFLERAYWKELISGKDAADTVVKKRWDGEDETLVMARRQTAAAYQKLLPPSHRIEINRVKPEETLKFKPQDNEKNIYELLNDINVFLIDSRIDGIKIPFTDLLDTRKFVGTYEVSKADQQGMLLVHKTNDSYLVEEDVTMAGQKTLLVAHEIGDKYLMYPLDDTAHSNDDTLTHLAWHGLHLPARTVLDFWQVAHCVVNDTLNTEKEKPFQAEKIARTILRNAIFRSDISSNMGQRLQYDIIRRSPDGGTVLNFKRVELTPYYLSKRDFELHCVVKEPSGYAIRPKLIIRQEVDIVGIGLKAKSKKSISAESDDDIPEIVAAWLSILHDILILVERLAVLYAPEIDTLIVAASHEVVTAHKRIKKDDLDSFWWPAPIWDTFLAYDVFWKRWTLFRDNIPKEQPKNDDLTRLLVAGWVACVLETFVALNRQSSLIEPSLAKKFLAKKTTRENERQIFPTEDIYDLESAVIKAADKLYFNIKLPSEPRKLFFLEKEMRDWLEKKLPLLFSYLYVPMDNEALAYLRCKEMIDATIGKESKLADYWQKNAPFFLADLDNELEMLFPKDKTPYKSEDSDDLTKSEEKYRHYINSLGPFGALHRYWKKSSFNNIE